MDEKVQYNRCSMPRGNDTVNDSKENNDEFINVIILLKEHKFDVLVLHIYN